MAEMTRDEVFEWLREGAGYARLATNGRDGYPHVVPLGYFMLDEDVILNMRGQREANVRRDPKVSICWDAGIVGDEHQRAGHGQRAAGAVDDAVLAFVCLPGEAVHAVLGGAGQLPVRLDEQHHAVHAGVAEREATTVGVDRDAGAARAGLAVRPQAGPSPGG
jgi:hypothetical protein